MIRLNLFMIWFLHFLSLLSVICRCYRQNSSSRIIVVLVYTVSHAFLTRGMAKIQVIMALTLDGFLPHEDEMLMRWVRENKRYGFPRWQRQATFHIYPHYGLMDLLNVKEKHDKDCIYLAGVGDGGSAEYADGLFRYNLVDETELFLLPLSYGGGIPLTGEFRSARWKLLGCKTFSNGICRLMYKRNG